MENMWTCCPQELELLCRPWQTCKRQRSFGYVSFPLLLSFWHPFFLELHFSFLVFCLILYIIKWVVRSFEDFATLVPIFNRGPKSRQGFCNLARFRFSHYLVGAITEVIIDSPSLLCSSYNYTAPPPWSTVLWGSGCLTNPIPPCAAAAILAFFLWSGIGRNIRVLEKKEKVLKEGLHGSISVTVASTHDTKWHAQPCACVT